MGHRFTFLRERRQRPGAGRLQKLTEAFFESDIAIAVQVGQHLFPGPLTFRFPSFPQRIQIALLLRRQRIQVALGLFPEHIQVSHSA